uniref:Transposaselike [Salmo salar] n=1 Tax=Lepeophtheirus salmonis TaxID=72036 RepID=A0A0K2U7P3_LEPSM
MEIPSKSLMSTCLVLEKLDLH